MRKVSRKTEQSLCDLWAINHLTYVYLESKGKRKRMGQNILKEIMAKNFPNQLRKKQEQFTDPES